MILNLIYIKILENFFYLKKKNTINYVPIIPSNKKINSKKNNFKRNLFIFLFIKEVTSYDFFLVLKKSHHYIISILLIFYIKSDKVIVGIASLILLDMIFEGDDPIYEPLEWTIVQTWILILALISWIAENMSASSYGKFTAKDKRAWFGWYKSLWLIEFMYIITLGVTIYLIITPFYFELFYSSSFVMNFWHWMSKKFYFNNLFLLTILIYVNLFIQINIRFIFYKKLFILCLINLFVLFFLFFFQFYITFFSFLTDQVWYTKTKYNSMINSSNDPLKWAWGDSKRDHFSYHQSKTVFWFKTDGPFAESLFLISLYYLFSLLFVLIFWLVLVFQIFFKKQLSYTYTLAAISSIRQLFLFFLLMYLFIFSSVVIFYLKFPFEINWLINNFSWYYQIINYFN